MTKKGITAARAFTLVEVALALGIAAFCLVAVFGLLPIGFNNNQQSMEQTAAANVACAVALDLQAMPKGTDPTTLKSPLYKIPAPPSPLTSPGTSVVCSIFLRADGTETSGPGASANAADNPRYRVTVIFVLPTATQVHYAVPTRILVTWPALADPNASTSTATLPVHYSGSMETNLSLLRE